MIAQQSLAFDFVPNGHPKNSPALQRRVRSLNGLSPVGTAEHVRHPLSLFTFTSLRLCVNPTPLPPVPSLQKPLVTFRSLWKAKINNLFLADCKEPAAP